MLESRYQRKVREILSDMFPGCVIIKNDPDFLQGIPDLLILYRDRWAMLEVKTSERAAIQPNQEYYVGLFGEMSYAAFIYPENEEDVFRELQQAFRSRRASRVSQR